MSHKATAWAFDQHPGSPVQKFVLIVLADAHNGHTGQCNPSVSRMAETTGYSKRAVIDALKALEAKGYIASTKGLGRRSKYELSFQESGAPPAPVDTPTKAPKIDPSGAADAPVGEPDQPPENTQSGAGDAPVQETHRCSSFHQLVQEVHPTGAGGAPEPGKNLEGNREDEDGGVVRVSAGWVVTFDWKPRDADICRARAAGVPQVLIDDPDVLADFRLKYSEAPQRDPAFGQRWVRWLVNEQRNPRTQPAAVGDSLRRWANGDD